MEVKSYLTKASRILWDFNINNWSNNNHFVLARRLYSTYLMDYKAKTINLTIVKYVLEDVYIVG
jgi:hypothetical protein